MALALIPLLFMSSRSSSLGLEEDGPAAGTEDYSNSAQWH